MEADGARYVPIVVVDSDGFFKPLLTMLEKCVEERFLDPRHRRMLSVVTDASSVVEAIEKARAWDGTARGFAMI